MSQAAQAATINYYKQGSLNHQHLFLTVLGSGKSKSKVWAVWVSAEGPLPSLQTASYLLAGCCHDPSLLLVHEKSRVIPFFNFFCF